MQLLADSSWLIHLERELASGRRQTALKRLEADKVYLSPLAHAEFLSKGTSAGRQLILKRLIWLRTIGHEDAMKAGQLRHQRARSGKALSLPDAFMAASAIRHGLHLVTGDRDFSGIPGLVWSSYKAA